ncbi:hypothetical protein [Pedosphaera parvula]|uniref:EF-hand domain-containing protein n=1 Tax=Pedosphaera parvula (strain Ellin514) TaxID=320771 RepID=B9XG54_PEDPL|nr:hypothetical protein [Pedosphaera parvula]EEF61216.1 conserved hypothetical protein [Pedosphaera parvula Ellin514]
MENNYDWKFFRAGGFDQVRLDTGADLTALDKLDQKLWVALACPTQGLEFDSKTLTLIDTDKDGRIRVPEIIAAVKWTCSLLKNPGDLLSASASLPLNAINDANLEGSQLLSSAKQILTNLGKKESEGITVEDTADTVKIFAQTQFNGDGIIPADAAEDPIVKGVISDIITCFGAENDRSGKPGVNQVKVDQFFAEAQAYSDWWQVSETEPAIASLGEATTAAAAAMRVVKVKVDDYFARCRLAAFDARAIAALNREEKEYLAIAAKDLTITASEVANFPLARIEAGKPLALSEAVNPAWATLLGKFQSDAVKPIIGDQTSITEADWAVITGKLAAYETWFSTKAGVGVEKLGLKRVRQILGTKGKEDISALIAKDKALEPESNAIAAVDKLVRYHRDLFKLLNNFVSFRDFYHRNERAVFQAGRLYLDQRSCDLCLTVEDPGKHALMAGLAGTYLAYCDLVRKATGEKKQIVAAFTDGDSDNLMVGRNGIFYDRKGNDWDATITKIIDNPISIRQAFWAPYKKLVRLIEEQVAKRAATADAAVNAELSKIAQQTVEVDKPKPVEIAKPATLPAAQKIDAGTLAAVSIVLTGIFGALGGIFGTIFGLPWWQIPLAFLSLILAISLPSVVMAYLKLRRRNLGPILDANGWAVNARAKINVPFGRSLTQVASTPLGAQRDLIDPFADKKTAQKWLLVILILAALGTAGYFAWKYSRPAEVKTLEPGTNAVGAADKKLSGNAGSNLPPVSLTK